MNQQRKQYTGSGFFLRSKAAIIPQSFLFALQVNCFYGSKESNSPQDVRLITTQELQVPGDVLHLKRQFLANHAAYIHIEDLTFRSVNKKIIIELQRFKQNGTVPTIHSDQYGLLSVNTVLSGPENQPVFH